MYLPSPATSSVLQHKPRCGWAPPPCPSGFSITELPGGRRRRMGSKRTLLRLQPCFSQQCVAAGAAPPGLIDPGLLLLTCSQREKSSNNHRNPPWGFLPELHLLSPVWVMPRGTTCQNKPPVSSLWAFFSSCPLTWDWIHSPDEALTSWICPTEIQVCLAMAPVPPLQALTWAVSVPVSPCLCSSIQQCQQKKFQL